VDELLRIVGSGLVASVILAFLRREAPSIGVQAAMAFVVLVLLVLLRPLADVLEVFRRLAEGAGVRPVYLALVLRAIGIAYLTSIGASLCRDAGEEAVAAVVELAGKGFILLLSVPVVAAVLEALIRLLPG